MSSLGPTDHEPSALLSDDTLSALELREQPFMRPETTAETYSDAVTTDQLADIKQALITGDDLLLILGEPGIGKSTLLAQLGDNSGLRIQCFSVEGNARFNAVNLFGGMLEAFKREPPDNLKTMLDELIPCLQGMISSNTLSAVIIDNADAVDAIELTRLLSAMLYMNSQDETLMRIALSAPPEFEERIPELLPEGADLPYSTLTIEPFEHERAASYLAWRFERAGETAGIPFDEAQIVDMNERARGNPRRLHEIVADELNSVHGELEPAIPPELLASSRSENGSLGATLLAGRSPKVLLGGLGVLLIGLGLLLFLPGGDDPDDRYAVVEQRNLDEQNADRLALVNEGTPTNGASDTQLSESQSSELQSSDAESPDPQSADLESSSPESSGAETNTPESTASDDPAAETTEAEPAIPGASDSQTSEASGAAGNTPDSPSEESNDLDATEGLAENDGVAGDVADDASDQALQDDADASGETVTIIEEGSGTEDPEQAPQDQQAEAASDSAPASDPAPDPAVEPGITDSSADSSSESVDEAGVDTAPNDAPDIEIPSPSQADELADAIDVPESGSQADPAPDTPTTAPSPISDPSAASARDGIESPNWILTQNPDLYTIQMIASTSRREVELFLTDANLIGPNSIFTFQRGGVDWYALVHGLYESVEEARSAIIRMPAAALSFQPWIRSIGRVQNSLRK